MNDNTQNQSPTTPLGDATGMPTTPDAPSMPSDQQPVGEVGTPTMPPVTDLPAEPTPAAPVTEPVVEQPASPTVPAGTGMQPTEMPSGQSPQPGDDTNQGGQL